MTNQERELIRMIGLETDAIVEVRRRQKTVDRKTHEGARLADDLRRTEGVREGRRWGLTQALELIQKDSEADEILRNLIRFSTPRPDTESDYHPRSLTREADEFLTRKDAGPLTPLAWRAESRGYLTRSTCGRYEIVKEEILEGNVTFDLQNGDGGRNRVTFRVGMATLGEAQELAEKIRAEHAKNGRG